MIRKPGRPPRGTPKSRPIWCGQMTEKVRTFILNNTTADERHFALFALAEENYHKENPSGTNTITSYANVPTTFTGNPPRKGYTMITDLDVKKAKEIYIKVCDDAPDIIYDLLFLRSGLARYILEDPEKRRLYGKSTWYLAAINCAKDEDIAPIAISTWIYEHEGVEHDDLDNALARLTK